MRAKDVDNDLQNQSKDNNREAKHDSRGKIPKGGKARKQLTIKEILSKIKERRSSTDERMDQGGIPDTGGGQKGATGGGTEGAKGKD